MWDVCAAIFVFASLPVHFNPRLAGQMQGVGFPTSRECAYQFALFAYLLICSCMQQAIPSGGRQSDPLGGAQVGKALLHSKGGFVAAQQKGGVGLIPPGGTELNNARPLHTYLAPPFALAAAGAVEGRYLCSVVREYRWVLFMRACAIIKPFYKIKKPAF